MRLKPGAIELSADVLKFRLSEMVDRLQRGPSFGCWDINSKDEKGESFDKLTHEQREQLRERLGRQWRTHLRRLIGNLQVHIEGLDGYGN